MNGRLIRNSTSLKGTKHMLKNILLAAALTASAFAATGAQAATGHDQQSVLETATGHYGFTIYSSCRWDGRAYVGSTTVNGKKVPCYIACAGFPAGGYCTLSYGGRSMNAANNRGQNAHGFAQGNFHGN